MECGMPQKNPVVSQMCETVSVKVLRGKCADLSNFGNDWRVED